MLRIIGEVVLEGKSQRPAPLDRAENLVVTLVPTLEAHPSLMFAQHGLNFLSGTASANELS